MGVTPPPRRSVAAQINNAFLGIAPREPEDPDAALYRDVPTAFWLDPNRWHGITDPKRQMFWAA